MKGFPYLPPSQKDLMNNLISSIEASVGPTLLPSQVAADVLHFQNDLGISQGSLDIRSGSPTSTVKELLDDEPGNSEYVDLEKELEEAIALTEELLAAAKHNDQVGMVAQSHTKHNKMEQPDIVMYDAVGVRLHAGKQAEVLNQIVYELPSEHPLAEARPLRELLGHTPCQVLAGSVLGIVIAVIGHLVRFTTSKS